MAINVVWLQRLWPVLKNSGPVISRLAEAYMKRGASRSQAEATAEMAVLLDQILDERLKDMARQSDLARLRQDLAALKRAAEGRAPRRNPYLFLVLAGEIVIIALLVVTLVRL